MRQILAFAAVVWAGAAHAGSEKRAVTPSGLPDMVFHGTTAAEASGKLANTCMNRGLAVIGSTPAEVVCQAKLNAMQSALTQALIGNSYSTPPQQFLRFSIVQIQDAARVQASAWVETQMAFGQIRKAALDNDDAHNAMMTFMEEAGAFFLPGTQLDASKNYVILV